MIIITWIVIAKNSWAKIMFYYTKDDGNKAILLQFEFSSYFIS